MSTLDRMLQKIADRRRAAGAYWDIEDHLRPDKTYLSRYYLMPAGINPITGKKDYRTRWTKWTNWVLHQFQRSDMDGLHTHPWFWISIVLTVGYWEHTNKGRVWRRPWSIAFRGRYSTHRVELDPTKPKPWTLFIMGPQRAVWGFFVTRGRLRAWIPHFIHLDSRDGQTRLAQWFERRRARKQHTIAFVSSPLYHQKAA